MPTDVTRRDFLKLTGATGATLLLAGCGVAGQKSQLSFLDRIFGRPLTELPQIDGAWSLSGSVLDLDLSKLPELADLGGAVRIEGEALSEPLLVVLGEDGNYYAFQNACTHGGRMIDPVAGTMTLECCSLSKSSYDYQGQVLSGPAPDPLTSYPIERDGDHLQITL